MPTRISFMLDKYLSIGEAAAKFGVSGEYLRALCRQRRIKGAQRIGRAWIIPESFEYVRQPPGRKSSSHR